MKWRSSWVEVEMELGVELELGKNKYILKLAFKYLSGVFVNFVNVSGKAMIICGCGVGLLVLDGCLYT